MKKHINLTTLESIKIDTINNLDLRSDLEGNNIYDSYLEAEGLINSKPKTYSIECSLKDGSTVINYQYICLNEYEEDLKTLGL